MGQIKAEIVAHSLSPQGDELISVLCTFPRIILAEVNTHRMLSKNTSSSRAIPIKKMIEAVQTNPFIPIAWQKTHPGMQGSEYLNLEKSDYAKRDWLDAKRFAVDVAQRMHKTGVTKQLCNRLLEPFMWTTMLITGPRSGWDNFFNLRCPQYKLHGGDDHEVYKSWKDAVKIYPAAKDATILDRLKCNKGLAEIHIMQLAECIYDALNENTPEQLKAGEWHIPFGDSFDESKLDMKHWVGDNTINKVKISTAMAARTSYTVVGEEKDIDYKKMIELHDRLLTQDPPHSSPMEHCARAMNNEEYDRFLKGDINFEIGYHTNELNSKSKRGWCRNFKGFIPYRHIIETK